MNNISFEFAHPWFLLILVVAIPLALIPFFRLKKARRRTRNKITSLVLHLIIVVLCTLVMSGFTIKKEDTLQKKETFIVVDVSRSIDNQADKIDEFVADILSDIDGNNKVGIVTFSDGATVASALTSNVSGVLSDLQNARKRGAGNATDINEALTFTANQFSNKKNAKIVIITDGIDTENNLVIKSDDVNEDRYEYTNNAKVLETVRALAKQGVSIDTVYFEPVRYDSDMQISKVVFRKGVLPEEKINITVGVQSHVNASATLTLYDKNVSQNTDFVQKAQKENCEIVVGDNPNIKFEDFSFETPGLHILKVELTNYGGDQIDENNVYYSYVNIETGKSVLIIDGDGKQANAGMKNLLENEMGYNVAVFTPQSAPQDIDILTDYNEIILMNVNVANLPNGYDRLLDQYVNKNGGGLFTTGGNQTYFYGGMDGTLFDSILPVNVVPEDNSVNGIMFVVDASGSMFFEFNETNTGGSTPKYHRSSSRYPETKMYQVETALREAAMTIFNKKDYVGLMHFGKKGISEDLPLTSAASRGQFVTALSKIDEIEGTQWKAPLEQAAQRLRDTSYDIDKKQIIFITDGDPRELSSTEKSLKFNELTQGFLDNWGITTSVIAINGAGTVDPTMLEQMTTAVTEQGEKRFYIEETIEGLKKAISDECKAASTETMNSTGPYDVDLAAAAASSPIFEGIVNSDFTYPQKGIMPQVQQYNGFSVKSGVSPLLTVNNTENGTTDSVFAYWTYGAGKVASFASDLADWASEYYTDPEANLLLKNAIKEIMPSNAIKSSLVVEYEKKNFTTEINVLTDLSNDQAVFIEVTDPDGNVTAYEDALRVTGNNKCTASVPNDKPGLYKIHIEKEDAYGNVTEGVYRYYTFSYSQEYDTFFGDDAELLDFLSNVSVVGNGHMLSLSDFEYNHSLDYITVVYDPKLLFASISAVLFILDIIARKFNFKWPHEWFMKKKEEAN